MIPGWRCRRCDHVNAEGTPYCVVCHAQPLSRTVEGATITAVGDRWIEVTGREGAALELADRALADILLPRQQLVVLKRRRRLFGGLRLKVGVGWVPTGNRSAGA
ncbi:hypothetical protein ACFO3J_21010 [Streptomyces polygonati]|uniref:RanBP2-type domain-containing protein n=1 Tax=Streptomyces polygonati TaxID=1617087 RepID=A0ABV8HS24_9ACTN